MSESSRKIIEEKLQEIIQDYPICEYRIIRPEDLVFSHNTRLLSEHESEHDGYRSWSMPPGVGTYQECLDRCNAYQQVLVFGTVFPAQDVANAHEWVEASVIHNQSTIQIRDRLKEVTEDVLALGIRCRICETCGYPDEACRHPDTMLHSIESYGINVMETAKKYEIPDFYDSHTIICFGLIFF